MIWNMCSLTTNLRPLMFLRILDLPFSYQCPFNLTIELHGSRSLIIFQLVHLLGSTRYSIEEEEMVLRRLATPLFLYIMMHTEELGRLISLGRTYLLVVSQIQNYSLRSIVIHIL